MYDNIYKVAKVKYFQNYIKKQISHPKIAFRENFLEKSFFTHTIETII